MSVLKYIGL